MKIRQLLLLLFLLLASLLAHAQDCDEFSVSFMVNGVNKWKGLSTVEIHQREHKTEFKAPGKGATEGLALKDLISPYAKQGVLFLYSCDGTNSSYEVANLLSDDSGDSNFLLILSKRNFFKLMKVGQRRSILKKVYQLKLVP